MPCSHPLRLTPEASELPPPGVRKKGTTFGSQRCQDLACYTSGLHSMLGCQTCPKEGGSLWSHPQPCPDDGPAHLLVPVFHGNQQRGGLMPWTLIDINFFDINLTTGQQLFAHLRMTLQRCNVEWTRSSSNGQRWVGFGLEELLDD